MSTPKVYLVQLLNTGVGPIFGPIMGALLRPSSNKRIKCYQYTIIFKSIIRTGASVLTITGRYLGNGAKHLWRHLCHCSTALKAISSGRHDHCILWTTKRYCISEQRWLLSSLLTTSSQRLSLSIKSLVASTHCSVHYLLMSVGLITAIGLSE